MGPYGCALLAALLAGSGGAERRLETTVQDDALLLHRPPAQVRATARRLAALGADRVRITAGWSDLAPAEQDRRRPPAPFDPTDSRTYPWTGFRRLDRAVKAATAAGLAVQVDVAFWAPRWAVRRGSPSGRRHRYAPDPVEFGHFARAVAARYSGGFPDPADRRRRLPAVRLWTTWNEPNEPAFLQPQWRRTGRTGPAARRWRPASPHVYRPMHAAAFRAITEVHGANRVLLGGTSSGESARGPGRGPVPPLRFLRELACVDARLRPLRVAECRGFRPLEADGWSHHPYSRAGSPGSRSLHPDAAPIADTDRLVALLDALHARGRITRRLDVWHTEYGYETNPPDPFHGIDPDRAARFHGWASWLAWREPRVRSFAQFLLRDIDPRDARRPLGGPREWTDFQTGLLTHDGRPKPGLQAFRLPFHAEVRLDAGVPVVLLFGQVRPGVGRQVVRVERRGVAGGGWEPVATAGAGGGARCGGGAPEVLTDARGVVLRTAPYGGPAWFRLARQRPDGRWEHGAEVLVDAALGRVGASG